MTVSQSDSLILKSRLSRSTPALLTRIVGAPSSSATRVDRGLDLGLVGDVAADGDRLAAGRGDLLHGVLAGGLVEVDYGDGAALGRQSYGGGGADAARSRRSPRRPAARWWTCWFSSPLRKPAAHGHALR